MLDSCVFVQIEERLHELDGSGEVWKYESYEERYLSFTAAYLLVLNLCLFCLCFSRQEHQGIRPFPAL